MIQPRGPTEDEKMAAIQRLSKRYHPSETPETVKGKEDYKRLKLTEAFQNVDTNRDGYITLDELLAYLNKKAREAYKDPNYQLSLAESEKIQIFFDSVDVDRQEMVNYFVRFQAVSQDKINRLTSRLSDIEDELNDLSQKRAEAEAKRNEFRKVIKVYLIEAQDLVPVGYYGSADPYAVVYFGNQKSRTATCSITPCSFVDNPNDKINIAIWDEGTADTPQGTCVKSLPTDPSYDQRMITEWVALTSADGKPGRGKLRIGVQYIFDQVRLIDTVINKREEEYKLLSEDLKYTEETLNETSEPFEILINPERVMKAQEIVMEKMPNPFTAAFGKVKSAFSTQVGAAENYVSTAVKDLRPPNMKWAQIAQISSIVYAFLSCLAAFAKEDFINLALSAMLCYVTFLSGTVTKSRAKNLCYLLAGSFLYDLFAVLAFYGDYMHDASYDGGVQTNLRRFVYIIMLALMLIKVPVTIVALMLAQEMREDVERAPTSQPMHEEFDPNILVRKDQKSSNPFAQYP